MAHTAVSTQAKAPRAITEVLRAPVRNLADAMAFINVLRANDYLFHFEDHPSTILKGRGDELLFTTAEAALADERVTECYEQNWEALGGEIECPIGYALSLQ